MTESSGGEIARDRGLLRRMGALGLAAAVFNTVVGAGIYVVPASLARDVGSAAPLAYLACVVCMGAVALCFAAASSRAPSSGGPYGFVTEAFGPLIGFLVGVLLWLGAVLAAGGIAAALADGIGRSLPVLAGPGARAGLILLTFMVLAAVNLAGVAPGARLVGGLTVVKLLPLLLLVAVALPRLGGIAAGAAPTSIHGGFGRAMILALFAFQGMETALGVSGEVSRPARNIPAGLLGAMATVAVLYMAVQASAQALLGPALGRAHAPLVEAMAAGAPSLAGIVAAGALVSMLGYLASDTLSAPRLLFAFAKDGLLPRPLGTLGGRSHAPTTAIVLHAALAATLAISGGFVELTVLSSLSTVVVYLVGCAAAWRLQHKGVALAGPPLRLPGLWLVVAVGVLSTGWIAAQATPYEALGCLGVLAASAAWFAAARRRAPAA